MLDDARGISPGSVLTTSVCIVGGGAAGITLALEFERSGVQVILLESGGTRADSATQSLYSGDVTGLPYVRLEESRSRFFGGSTNCWGGICRPMDPLDFEARDWIPNSGWPFGYQEMERFYHRAHDILKLGPFEYGSSHWESQVNAPKFRYRDEPDRIEAKVSRFSGPARLGQMYASDMADAKNVRVILHANVTNLHLNNAKSEVTCADVATLDGIRFSVNADVFVLATGGIENARLLLVSNHEQVSGIGNGHDQVGRYFMEHPRLRTSQVHLVDPQLRSLYDNTVNFLKKGLPIGVHLAPSAATQRAAKLPNSRTYVRARYFHSFSKSVFALKRIRTQMVERRKFGVPLSKAVREVARSIPDVLIGAPEVALSAVDKLTNFNFKHRQFYLETVIEPVPNYDSRVVLSDRKDVLGLPKVALKWKLTELDRENFKKLLTVLKEDMTDIFRPVRNDPAASIEWPDDVDWCWHHMGTTRMHENPAKGVVDANSRVHGVENLFIAGSSVFPTVGSDLPTLTIVALSVRLADHIKRRIPGLGNRG